MKPKQKQKKAAKSATKSETKKIAPAPSYIPKCISTKDSKVLIVVEAKPGSKSDEIYEICDEFIGVAVQAEPKGGEANANIIEFVADVLKVKKTNVSIDKGGKSKSKLIEVEGISALEVYEKLKAQCPT